MIIRTTALIGALLFCSLAAAQSEFDRDRQLIVRAAGQQAQQPANDQADAAPTQEDLDSAEGQARHELLLSQARLELVLARKALRDNQPEPAARRAKAALSVLATLPESPERESFELQAEGILVRAERAGVDVAAIPASAPESAAAGRSESRKLPTPAVLRAEQNKESWRVQSWVDLDVAESELRMLTEADAARVVPGSEIAYPPDWAVRTARRQPYASGQIARSESWVDEKGQEWYVALYDIRELSYVPPDFVVPGGVHPWENLMYALDREALRRRSMIFSGYADDLAAGLPLLNFFGGGVDPFLLRGPKYSPAAQQQIADMVQAFLDRTSEARVITVPSVNP